MSNRGTFPGEGGRYKPAYPRNAKISPELATRIIGNASYPQVNYNGSALGTITVLMADALGDELVLPVLLGAGKYTLSMCHQKRSDGTIVTVEFDAVVMGTIDTYTGVATLNQFGSVDFESSYDGLHEFRFRMLTKNASSSGYALVAHHFVITERVYR